MNHVSVLSLWLFSHFPFFKALCWTRLFLLNLCCSVGELWVSVSIANVYSGLKLLMKVLQWLKKALTVIHQTCTENSFQRQVSQTENSLCCALLCCIDRLWDVINSLSRILEAFNLNDFQSDKMQLSFSSYSSYSCINIHLSVFLVISSWNLSSRLLFPLPSCLAMSYTQNIMFFMTHIPGKMPFILIESISLLLIVQIIFCTFK